MSSIHRSLVVAAVACLAAFPIQADECRYEDQRDRSFDTTGVTSILIDAGAGFLVVEGRDESTDLVATARACASSRELLDELDLRLERRGDRLVLETRHPSLKGWGWKDRYARLDLTVELPSDIPVEIEDSSGSLEARDVAALEIDDSSGSIELFDIRGPITVDDSSGSIRIDRVAGSVRVWDSSGSIDIGGVDGSVVIEDDSSGSIRVSDVTGDVLVEHDSSGSISVRDVQGDFSVGRDGSGGIDYRNVSGRVDVPSDR